MVEPSKVRAGTTAYWEREIDEYDAGTWSASYKFFASGLSPITVTSTGSGTTYTVNAAPATTSGWAAGNYAWVLQVTDGTDIFEIDSGTIEIVAATATGNDLLDARGYLDQAEQELVERVTGKASSYSIKDRSLTRMSAAELRQAITYWRKRVTALEDADRARKGLSSRRISSVRFC